MLNEEREREGGKGSCSQKTNGDSLHSFSLQARFCRSDGRRIIHYLRLLAISHEKDRLDISIVFFNFLLFLLTEKAKNFGMEARMRFGA